MSIKKLKAYKRLTPFCISSTIYMTSFDENMSMTDKSDVEILPIFKI